MISVAVEPKSKADQDKLGNGPRAARRGGSDLPRHVRRGDGPDAHRRHGRAAPRDHRRPPQARVQRRRERRPPAGRLPRDDLEAGREDPGQVRAPDGRLGPVRRRRHQPVPQEPGAGYEFEDKIVGGKIPKEYIKPIDEGIQEAMGSGILAGYPVVDVKVELIDGSYHDVDSSERAFKIAGSMAFKEAMKRAKPKLLEPMMAVEVTTPEDYLGDVMGNLNSRRGRIENMAPVGNAQVDQGERPAERDVRLRDRPALDVAGPRTISPCSSTGTRKCRHRSRARSPSRAARLLTSQRKEGNGQAEVRAHEAAPQRRHDRAHRPREDDADRRDHEACSPKQGGGGQVQELRRDRQRSRGAPARHHDQHVARRVRDGEPSLRARRLPGSRRLHQEHDHGRRADGRRDPRRLRRRRPDAADARAHPPRPPGRGAVHRRRAQQGRHGRRRGAARARRARGSRAALEVRVPRRRHPDRPRLGAEGARGRRGVGGRRSSS